MAERILFTSNQQQTWYTSLSLIFTVPSHSQDRNRLQQFILSLSRGNVSWCYWTFQRLNDHPSKQTLFLVTRVLENNKMTEEKFEEEKFMKNLVNLKDTQDSIQCFSGWCIRNRKSAYKMARCWVKVIKKVRSKWNLLLQFLEQKITTHTNEKLKSI